MEKQAVEADVQEVAAAGEEVRMEGECCWLVRQPTVEDEEKEMAVSEVEVRRHGE